MTDPTSQVVSLFDKPTHGRSLFGDAARRLLRSPLAVIGLIIVLFMIAMAVFAARIAPFGLLDCDLNESLISPSLTPPFGTDDIGCDIYSRVIYGARVSLSIAVFSMVVSVVIGSLAGLVAGYYGGLIDIVLM